MKRKLNVAVLMGGKSSEHEISLMTGNEVLEHLSKNKYNVFPVIASASASILKVLPQLQLADIVFIAMHGFPGEDGTFQGLFDSLGIKYTGSGILPSALGMSKLFSRKLFREAKLNIPKYRVLYRDLYKNKDLSKIKLPVFVHPDNQGSAIGSSLVRHFEQLKPAVTLAHRYSTIAMVDEYLKGTEITCAILGNKNPIPLPVIEIVPKKNYFDFEAKYDPKLTDEIVPARINENLANKAQKIAIEGYRAIGCKVFGRADMIIRNNQVYILEVNTIPGLTAVSLFPKAAQAAGIPYPLLLDKIIEYSLQKYEH